MACCVVVHRPGGLPWSKHSISGTGTFSNYQKFRFLFEYLSRTGPFQCVSAMEAFHEKRPTVLREGWFHAGPGWCGSTISPSDALMMQWSAASLILIKYSCSRCFSEFDPSSEQLQFLIGMANRDDLGVLIEEVWGAAQQGLGIGTEKS